jgi:hypothetical protein
MRRRTFLGALAGSTIALSGCASGSDPGEDETTTTAPDEGTPTPSPTETPTPTETPSPAEVAATLTVQAPMGNRRTSVAVEDGRVVYTIECGGSDDGPDRRVEAAVASETTAALDDRVAAAEPGTWADYYDCETDCPTDVPSVDVTITVDDRTYETGYYSGRQEPLPADLQAVVDLLDGLRADLSDEVESIDCHAQ